ncbi:MAG TPA: aminotransferase class V-fold PLP-dependent enzyme, partial [Nocardioides sp.]
MTGPATGRGDLDSASSTPLHPAARDVLLAALERGYADPRRLHRAGREARLLLDNAREATADALGVRPDEVTFTPSGTHAVHLGLLGLVRGSRRGDGVVHSAVEHSAVGHAVAWGARAVEVGVDSDGRVRSAGLAEAASTAAVVALQTANHEVGTLQPVGELELPEEVPLFTDACASMGRLPLPDGWAAAAGSAHKWGGPAGVGVLLVR